MLSSIATVLLVPPVNLAVLALAGAALGWRRLTAAALVLLLLLGMPEVSRWMLVGLERGLPAASETAPQAIVILGGDIVPVGEDAEPQEQDIGPLTLERLRWGAALQHASGLPLLVTGGVLGHGREPLAAMMARSLQDNFAAPPRWVEPAAQDTWQNARLAAQMLRQDGIERVYVVTHPWHMRRALLAFARSGLAAVPAPLPQDAAPAAVLGDFIPRESAWHRSYFALHEWIGCFWYAAQNRWP